MLCFLSPTKTLNPKAPKTTQTHEFSSQTDFLMEQLLMCSRDEIAKGMKLKGALLEETMDKIYAFQDKGGTKTQALWTYSGLQYKQLKDLKWTDELIDFAEQQVRIVSGLYGLLKPKDGIVPYRLEMQFKTKQLDVTAYWIQQLHEHLKCIEEEMCLLCSQEYLKVLLPNLSDNQNWATVEFFKEKNGKLLQQATLSKMARGQMLKMILTHHVTTFEGCKQFDWNGFHYDENHSGKHQLVFVQMSQD